MNKKKELLFVGVAIVAAGLVYVLYRRAGSNTTGPVAADYTGSLPGLASSTPEAATFTPTNFMPDTGAPVSPWQGSPNPAPQSSAAAGGGSNSSCCGCGTSANSNSLYYGSPADIAAAYAAIAPAAANSNPVPIIAPAQTTGLMSFLSNLVSGGNTVPTMTSAAPPANYSGNSMFLPQMAGVTGL